MSETSADLCRTLIVRASWLCVRGRHYEARRVLSRAKEAVVKGVTPSNIVSLDLMQAHLAFACADLSVAEEYCRRVLVTGGVDSLPMVAANHVLARVCARTGRPEECIDALEAALECAGADGVATPDGLLFDLHRGLWQALRACGRNDEAEPHFLTAYDIGFRAPGGADKPVKRGQDDRLDAVAAAELSEAAVKVGFEILDETRVDGIQEGDWAYALRFLGFLDSLDDPGIGPRLDAWLKAAEEHCHEGRCSTSEGIGNPREGTLQSLTMYAELMKAMHPRNVCDADVREAERRFEQAQKVMDIDALREWLSDVELPFSHTRGWKTFVRLWRVVFMRADGLGGCLGSRALAETGRCAYALGTWCELVGERNDSVRFFRLALEYDKAMGRGVNAPYSARHLARALLRSGDPDEAMVLLEESVKLMDESPYAGEDSSFWGRGLRAEILAAAGERKQAEELMREEVRDHLATCGPDGEATVYAQTSLAEQLLDWGRSSEARELLDASRVIREDESGCESDSSPEWSEFSRLVLRLRRAVVAGRVGDDDAAEEFLGVARAADALLGPGSPLAADAMTEWAALQWAAGRRDRAIHDAAKESLRVQRRNRHSNHEKVVRAREVMRTVCGEADRKRVLSRGGAGRATMYQSAHHPWEDDFDFARFRRRECMDFFGFLRIAHLLDPQEFRWGLLTHLARLYASGSKMPPYSPFAGDEGDDEKESHPEANTRQARWHERLVQRIADTVKASMGNDDLYCQLDWPYDEKADRTRVSSEVASIYSDLMAGAREWDEGRYDDAASTWILGFEEGGWGQSCLSVLKWLHVCADERWSLLVSERTATPQADSASDPER